MYRINVLMNMVAMMLAALPCALHAETRVNLDSLLEQALIESPTMAEIQRAAASRRAEGMDTGSMENPTLDAEVRVPTSYRGERGASEIAVSLAQPLRWSDFGVRERVNQLIQEEMRIDKKVALLELTQGVRMAYTRSWSIDRRVQQLEQHLREAQQLVRFAREASEKGVVTPGDDALLKAEVTRLEMSLHAARDDSTRARVALVKVAGVAVTGELEAPVSARISLEEITTTSGIPILERARVAVSLAKAQERMSQLDAYPRFAPRAVYERSNDYTDFFGAGISIELPIGSKNKAERLLSTAEVTAALSQQKYLSSEFFSEEVKASVASFNTRLTLLQKFEEEVLPTLRRGLEAEQTFLHSGHGSVFRVWQMLREVSSAEDELLEYTLNVSQQRTELALLLGREI